MTSAMWLFEIGAGDRFRLRRCTSADLLTPSVHLLRQAQRMHHCGRNLGPDATNERITL
ncbi:MULTISPECIES: hypothetical protein [unclassified Xanthomonas]|uniref:hypothetical protein n=1 Tax=Xanthomonas sp. LMG 8992 TaxID=1591157 RepID=UPI001369A96F|nr:hypothetical protein [Xanthomonas sp. LMG 8992]